MSAVGYPLPTDPVFCPPKAKLEYGDFGAVSARSAVLDRHSPACAVDHQGRATVVPLSRRTSRRISKTLSVERTCCTGKTRQSSIASLAVAHLSPVFQTVVKISGRMGHW
jgi:hypothetical protein